MSAGTAGRGSPPVNIFQQGDDFVAVIELPGIDKNDLQIEAKKSTIRISGKKTINYDESASMHRRERTWCAFDRTISILTQIDPNGTRAEYGHGVLVLFIPQAASQKPRAIRISG